MTDDEMVVFNDSGHKITYYWADADAEVPTLVFWRRVDDRHVLVREESEQKEVLRRLAQTLAMDETRVEGYA